MNEKIYESRGLEIWKKDERFFVRYDAGSHQVVMREDEISADEANRAIQSEEAATKMLFTLQKKLIQAGINPYLSNTN